MTIVEIVFFWGPSTLQYAVRDAGIVDFPGRQRMTVVWSSFVNQSILWIDLAEMHAERLLRFTKSNERCIWLIRWLTISDPSNQKMLSPSWVKERSHWIALVRPAWQITWVIVLTIFAKLWPPPSCYWFMVYDTFSKQHVYYKLGVMPTLQQPTW